MRDFFLLFVPFFSGCFFCRYLQTELDLSAIVASALVGFLGTFFNIPSLYNRKELEALIYSGSFAGMCTLAIFQSPFHLFLLSLIGTFIFLLFRPHFNGTGGKLGLISMVSSIIFFLVIQLW